MTVINNRFNLSIIKKLIKLFYLHYSCKKLVEKSNKENLKFIKNILPNKSGNPEKIIRAAGSSSTNVHIAGEDLLRVLKKLFSLKFSVTNG